jgi:uncharacterized protein (DUF302 family)
MSENKSKKTVSKGKLWLSALIGGVVGFLLCGVVMFMVMPSMMIVTKESELGFDETTAALEERIPQNGWVVSDIMDMNKSMEKHGVVLEPRVKIIKLCQPEYAKNILTTDRHISCMMPCTMSVWEGDDGKVYLSKMNMGLMAKMFGGNIAEVMGGGVAGDEEKILEGLLKQ